MRPGPTLRQMEEEGVDFFKLFQLRPGEPKDYTELGFPAQGVAIKLKAKSVIQKKGIKLCKNHGHMTRRTLWIQGCNYNSLLDHWLKIMTDQMQSNAMQMQCDQEMAVLAN